LSWVRTLGLICFVLVMRYFFAAIAVPPNAKKSAMIAIAICSRRRLPLRMQIPLGPRQPEDEAIDSFEL
jgi:hypothetical protein